MGVITLSLDPIKKGGILSVLFTILFQVTSAMLEILSWCFEKNGEKVVKNKHGSC